MGYEAKWLWDAPGSYLDVLECPAAVPETVNGAVQGVALAAYRALGCRDWARVDVRLDASGAPNVIEVNPLPGIIPDLSANSCFPNAAHAAGIGYDQLIQSVTRIAWRRLTGRALEARAEAA
jgi:D-alanine-D-alanine ligase